MSAIGNLEPGAAFQLPDIPLATFRRNSQGSRFSEGQIHDQDRGEKIFDDITKGNYDCPICSEALSNDDKLWSCRNCHNVYHFACIQTWAKDANFRCPTCNTDRRKSETNVPKCWCGNELHENLDAIGNTCGKPCNHPVICRSRRVKCLRQCSKICHPGPCEPVVCRPDCPTKVNHTPAVLDALEAQENQRVRNHDAGAGAQSPQGRPLRLAQEQAQQPNNAAEAQEKKFTMEDAAIEFIFLSIFQLSLIGWAITSIDKRVYPLQYLYYTRHQRVADVVCAILFGCIILGLCNFLLVSNFCFAAATKITKRLTNPLLKTLVFLFFIALGIVLSLDFPVLFFAAPVRMWNNNMKNGVTGFDTRVGLGDGVSALVSKVIVYGAERKEVPRGHQFLAEGLKSLESALEQVKHHKDVNPFWFAHVADDRHPSTEKFRSFYRMEGKVMEEHMAVDFDLREYTWRMVNISQPNSMGNPIKNGTWTKTTEKKPHARFPELGLLAPQFHYFTQKCQYEGFMMFFKTDGMTEQAILRQANRQWSPHNDANVVMRTMNEAGPLYISRLEVRARKADYEVDGERRKGLGDDFVVPMGLMAILRQKKIVGDGYSHICHMF